MSLQHLKLDAISEADLARLVADGIGESKTLEYKQAIPLVTDEQKVELLMRPLFDQIWNACGWHGSINYDRDGNWREHG